MRRLAILGVMVLTGCSGALTCNDGDAKSRVFEVVDSYLESALWYRDMKPGLGGREIFGVSTTDSNEDLGRYSCSATYMFEYKGRKKEVDFSYGLRYLEDKGESEVLVDVDTVKSRYMSAAMGY